MEAQVNASGRESVFLLKSIWMHEKNLAQEMTACLMFLSKPVNVQLQELWSLLGLAQMCVYIHGRGLHTVFIYVCGNQNTLLVVN